MAQCRSRNQRVKQLDPVRAAQLNSFVFDEGGNWKVCELCQPLTDQGIFSRRDAGVA
jgi:hypothetical protein